MFKWLFNIFNNKRKYVEVKAEEYMTTQEINGVKYLVPEKDWQPAIKYNDKGEPEIVYLKQEKLDTSGLKEQS